MEDRAASGETSLIVVNRPFDSSDDDDDGRDAISVNFTTQRLDHILQFLDCPGGDECIIYLLARNSDGPLCPVFTSLCFQEAKSALKHLWKVPEIIISTNNIILRNQETSVLRITKRCRAADVLFQIGCEGVPIIKEKRKGSDYLQGNSFRFPQWLEAAGIIEPDHTVEISVHREMFHTVADNQDEEVELVVKVSGSYMTETVNRRVRVCHCSSKEEQSNLTSNGAYQSQLNVPHHSDIQRLSNSYDMYRN